MLERAFGSQPCVIPTTHWEWRDIGLARPADRGNAKSKLSEPRSYFVPRRAIVTILLLCISAAIIGYVADRSLTRSPPGEVPPMPILGKFTLISPPLPAPALGYVTRNGTATQLADFRGHWLLVNLWATWCAPCIKEMPSLDRMKARFGAAVEVVAIAEDRNGASTVNRFLSDHAVNSLTIGLDQTGAIANALHVEGLPTSFLIDPQGRIVARLEGAAAWDTGPTLATLRGLMTAKQKS
jgi:thiol-disulfide isomerase/thioredoxin